jgi:hypothetical protein
VRRDEANELRVWSGIGPFVCQNTGRRCLTLAIVGIKAGDHVSSGAEVDLTTGEGKQDCAGHIQCF